MRSVHAAVTGLFLGGILLVERGVAWEWHAPMWRERLFIIALNAVVLGWLLGLVLSKAARQRSLLPFALGLLGSLAFAGYFALGFALAAVAFSLRSMASSSWQRAFLPLSLLAHLALPASLLIPADEAAMGFAPAVPLAAAPAELPPLEVSAAHPDVLLVVVDTLRADAILDPTIPTPHLDALRARGLWAPAALAPANQTIPSHLCLLSSLDIMKVGMRGNLSRWPTAKQLAQEWNAQPLATRLADIGYRTAAVVTNPLLHLVPEGHGFQEFSTGFQTWDPLPVLEDWPVFMDWVRGRTLLGLLMPKHLLSFPLSHLLNPNDRSNYRQHVGEGKVTTDRAIDLARGLQADKRPHFLLAQYFDPHSPYVAPPPFAGTLATDDNAPEGFDSSYHSDYAMRVQMRDAFAAGATVESQADISRFQHLLYKQEVAFFDDQFGRLLETIDASGRPTLIVFTADHGEGFGRHGNVEHGESLHEEEILVPMIVAGVGIEPGQLAGTPQLIDAAYTILARSGASTMAADGHDLGSPAPAEAPLAPIAVRLSEVTIREGGWKLIAGMRYGHEKMPDGSEGKEMPVRGEFTLTPHHLYRLSDDPSEQQDRLGAAQDGSDAAAATRLQALMARLTARLQQDFYPDLPERTLSPKERDQLNQLGYVDGQ